MPRRVVKIYLAAPPDLREERELLLEVLEELNDTKAAARNVVFELVNPEPGQIETRTEAQIANCDLFVLMLWKSWGEGHSPEVASIQYQFSLAHSAFENNGRPQLLIYFRSVWPFMMADPGVQLQQVIDFRNLIEAETPYPFTLYDRPLVWRNIFSLHLSQWLNKPQSRSPSLQRPFYRSLKESLYFPLRDELDSEESTVQPQAVEYAIKALDLLDEGRLTAAEESFSRALDIDDGPQILHSFGVYLQRIGSLDRAEKIFQRLLTKSLAQENVNQIYQSVALTNLGLVYARRAGVEPTAFGATSAGRLVSDYMTGRPGWKYVNLRHSFERLPYATQPKTLEHGLVTAFRDKDTEPFGQMVSHLYHYSPPSPRVEVLQTLVSNVGGPAGVFSFAPAGSHLERIGRLSSSQAITEREASEIKPESVQVLATQAAQRDSFTIDKIGRIYSGYPEIVKTLGAKPLSITLSSMAEREAANPDMLPTVKQFLAQPKKAPQHLKVEPKLSFVSDTLPTEQEPPASLVANSWFEDGNGKPLTLRTSLIAGKFYKYLFAIERDKRLFLFTRSGIFKEPAELAQGGDTKVQVEVICPLLKTKNAHKVSVRTVRYYSGKGIHPLSFPLLAATPGDYFLTIRVFYIRRLLYRAVVPIKVVDKELGTTLTNDNLLSRSNEMSRGDHV